MGTSITYNLLGNGRSVHLIHKVQVVRNLVLHLRQKSIGNLHEMADVGKMLHGVPLYSQRRWPARAESETLAGPGRALPPPSGRAPAPWPLWNSSCSAWPPWSLPSSVPVGRRAARAETVLRSGGRSRQGPCARSAARSSPTSGAGALAASWRLPSRVRQGFPKKLLKKGKLWWKTAWWWSWGGGGREGGGGGRGWRWWCGVGWGGVVVVVVVCVVWRGVGCVCLVCACRKRHVCVSVFGHGGLCVVTATALSRCDLPFHQKRRSTSCSCSSLPWVWTDRLPETLLSTCGVTGCTDTHAAVLSGHGPPSHLVSEVHSGGRCGQSRTSHFCAMPTLLSHRCVNESGHRIFVLSPHLALHLNVWSGARPDFF